MTGARLVHDTLEACGWSVEIADAQKVKGLAPLACKTDRIDSLVLAVLSQRDLVPAIWLPDPRVREKCELARFRLHLVKHRSALKNRIHSTLINFGGRARSPTCSGSRGAVCWTDSGPRAVAREHHRGALADRRPRAPDRRDQPAAEGRPRRAPLHPRS
jgi:transposase